MQLDCNSRSTLGINVLNQFDFQENSRKQFLVFAMRSAATGTHFYDCAAGQTTHFHKTAEREFLSTRAVFLFPIRRGADRCIPRTHFAPNESGRILRLRGHSIPFRSI